MRNRDWPLLYLVLACLGLILAIGFVMFANAEDIPLPPQRWDEMGKYGYTIDTITTITLDAKTHEETERDEYRLTVWAHKKGDPAVTPVFSYFVHNYAARPDAIEAGDNWLARVRAWIAVNKKEKKNG